MIENDIQWKSGLISVKELSKKAFLIQKARRLRRKPTAAEAVFQRKLQEAGFDFIFQYKYQFEGFAGIVDFYLKGYKVLIEIDGGYHLQDEQQQTDRIKDWVCHNQFKKPVLRFTNNQALYLSISQITTLIDDFFVKVKHSSPNRLKHLQSWRDKQVLSKNAKSLPSWLPTESNPLLNGQG